jgi:hypothetical protein
VQLVDASPFDYETILRLNREAVPHVNLISDDVLRHLHQESCYFRIAKSDDAVGGFLLGLPEEAQYESVNYQWFAARFPSFVYIDRVVIAPSVRRQGVGRRLYADLERVARARAPLLACEVNLRPPNAGSMHFHESFGFKEVGQQDTEEGTKRVRLMVKSLSPETHFKQEAP